MISRKSHATAALTVVTLRARFRPRTLSRWNDVFCLVVTFLLAHEIDAVVRPTPYVSFLLFKPISVIIELRPSYALWSAGCAVGGWTRAWRATGGRATPDARRASILYDNIQFTKLENYVNSNRSSPLAFSDYNLFWYLKRGSGSTQIVTVVVQERTSVN